jgi:glycosyltransferase involved in cell wall biosynthesis
MPAPIATTSTTGPASVSEGAGLPKVFIWQPSVFHYRVPVFDDLRTLGHTTKTFDLRVLGTLAEGGKAVGGEKRDYFIDDPEIYIRRFGAIWLKWQRASEIIAEHKPDVVIMQANLRSLSCWSIPSMCRKMGIPCFGWGKINSYSKVAWVSNQFKKHFFKRFDGLVVYSQSSRKELLDRGIPDERIVVAQNTIDTRRIFSDWDRIAARAAELRKHNGLEGKIVLQCIGRMDPEKRHADLINAWPELRKLDDRLRLVLVSGGPLLDQIKAHAKQVDAERIVVTGRVPEGDDYCWIAASDISIYPGAVGLAINQSLALKKPTIIADEWGADGELIVHGKTGYRFPRGDLGALVAAVKHVLMNPAEADGFAHSAQAIVRDEVTIENYVNKLNVIIQRGLAMRAKR